MFRSRRHPPLLHWLVFLTGWALLSSTGATVRDEEIAECRVGEISTWPDGTDRPAIGRQIRIVYRHDGAPAWFDAATVSQSIDRAAQAWSGCGIPAELVASDGSDGVAVLPDTVVILWDEAGSLGNFGLANPGKRRLFLGPQAFRQLRKVNPGYDARQTLQMVISHELGHFFGLMAHSRRCVDVLSYYHDDRGNQCQTRDPSGLKAVVEYRSQLPTACDIARCRAVNRISPLKNGRLQ